MGSALLVGLVMVSLVGLDRDVVEHIAYLIGRQGSGVGVAGGLHGNSGIDLGGIIAVVQVALSILSVETMRADTSALPLWGAVLRARETMRVPLTV